jgi:hypothetical protein
MSVRTGKERGLKYLISLAEKNAGKFLQLGRSKCAVEQAPLSTMMITLGNKKSVSESTAEKAASKGSPWEDIRVRENVLDGAQVVGEKGCFLVAHQHLRSV